MLLGINPVLHADILHTLASMGHGDDLVICDANFPASAVADKTVLGTHIQAGVDAITTLNAVLSVFPIDTFDLANPPAKGMQVVGEPDTIPEFIMEATPILRQAGADIALVERHAFYQTAQNAYAVIRTTETRFYGNLILRKGVVNS